jgi:predicted translin family RNA/ssDNA-binding protein
MRLSVFFCGGATDIQKNAKQAIFSLHRGGTEQAAKQLATCGA